MGYSMAGKPEPTNLNQPKISKFAHVNGSVDDDMEWLQHLSKQHDEIKKRCCFQAFTEDNF